jgi:uncharacterized protein YqgC (DUF456 family)
MGADAVLVAIVAVVMVIGLAGTVLPILPGIWVIWAAACAYALIGGMSVAGWLALGLITALAVAGSAASVVVPQRKASAIGVPLWGQVLATTMSVIGLFVVPVVGAPLGFAFGILLVMVARTGDIGEAWAATLATIRSMVIASGLQLAAGATMIAVWIGWVIAA